MKILVTGASGYIGGRLVPRLLAAGHQVRCLVRSPEKILLDPWAAEVEVARADVLDPSSLDGAMDGCDAAVYLIHSMEAGSHDFEDRDRRAASNFRDACDAAGLRRVVYLGGLGDPDGDLSPHLSSRHEVGEILRSGSTPTTELRAAVIIGSGSVSFEMLRHLTEVLPVMITPSWVRTMCQPIAVADVLDLLVQALEDSSSDTVVHEIGGPDQLTYQEMMEGYALIAGLRRRIIVPVPVLTPRLSSHWVGLVTPLPVAVAKPLVESLRVEVTVEDNSHAESSLGELVGYREAVERALQRSADLQVPTRWSDAGGSPALPYATDPEWSGATVLSDERIVTANSSTDDLYRAVTSIGGTTGYYAMNWAWGVRGLVDSIIGGVGLRRGRRHPEEITPGEALDFWRVVRADGAHHFDLHAEMKLPGQAWLSFEMRENGEDRATLIQRALFVPRGLAGRLYWLVLKPFHHFVFRNMAERLVRQAEDRRGDAAARG